MVYDMENIERIGEGAFAGTMMGMASPVSPALPASPSSPALLNTSIRSISPGDVQYSPKKLDFTVAELDTFEISFF